MSFTAKKQIQIFDMILSRRNGIIRRTLCSSPDKKGSLQQNGLTVISFCLHTQGKKESYFLKDHLLLYVKSDIYTFRFNDQEYTVRINEMVFIHKSILIEYDKTGEPGSELLSRSRF